VTENLRLLPHPHGRLGEPHCPDCDLAIGTQTSDEVVDKIMAEPEGARLYIMAPLTIDVGERYETLWEELRKSGYVRVTDRWPKTHSLDKLPTIDRRRKHAIEVVLDRIVVKPDGRRRIADTIEKRARLGQRRSPRRLAE